MRKVREDPAHEPNLAGRHHLAFDARFLRQHPAGIAEQLGIVGDGAQVCQRPADVAGDDVEQRAHRRCEEADFHVHIEEHRADIGAVEHILQIVGGEALAVQRLLELAVERGQLFVQRLELLLRCQQFLVGGLELLVDRERLLVDRLLLLIGKIALVNGYLELGLGGLQLTLQLGDAQRIGGAVLRGCARAGGGLLHEADQQQLLSGFNQALDLDTKPHCVTIHGDPGAAPIHAGLGRAGPAYRQPQLGPQARRGHGEQIQRGIAGRHPQKAMRGPQGKQALVLAIDQHGGRRVAGQHRPVAQIGQAGLPRRRRILSGIGHTGQPIVEPEGKFWCSRAAVTHMTVAAIGLGDGLEPALGLGDRFRCAQHQLAAIPEREMEQGDDFRLRLGIQVDQQIAARDEVHARERRV